MPTTDTKNTTSQVANQNVIAPLQQTPPHPQKTNDDEKLVKKRNGLNVLEIMIMTENVDTVHAVITDNTIRTSLIPTPTVVTRA